MLQPLADLLLGVADAVVRVDREPAELDLDRGLVAVVVRFHARQRTRQRSRTREGGPQPALSCMSRDRLGGAERPRSVAPRWRS